MSVTSAIKDRNAQVQHPLIPIFTYWAVIDNNSYLAEAFTIKRISPWSYMVIALGNHSASPITQWYVTMMESLPVKEAWQVVRVFCHGFCSATFFSQRRQRL